MNLFPKRRKQRDFHAEIESHITLEADRLRQQGWSENDAEFTARRGFGNVSQANERFYESQRVLWLEDLQKDTRYALRALRHSPVFAVTVILTLALGIGAASAIFSVVDAALIRPLPFPDAQRLVSVYEHWQGDLDSLAPADYLEYAKQAKSFEALAAYWDDSFNLGGQNRPERIRGAIVTPNFFSVLGVPAVLGRPLDSVQDKPGSQPTVVLSYSLWRRRYGSSSAVIGTSISVDGESRIVVGVMPAYLTFPGNVELWAAARYRVPEHPLRPLVDPSDTRSSHYFEIIGRLRSTTSLPAAQAEMNLIGRRLKQQYQDEEEGDGPALVSLREDLVGNVRPAIFILLAAAAMLFLIACANVANIVLARSSTRQKEIAIRGSLGAGRLRIVRQLLAESFILALAGAAVGVIAARFGLHALGTLLPSDVVPPGGLQVDVRLVIFAVAVCVLGVALFGIVPAIHAAKTDLSGALKDGGRTSGEGVARNRIRRVLVAMQIALAAILLTFAGLLLRSFDRLLSAPPGFNADQVLSLQLSLPIAQYRTPADRNRFVNQVLDRIRSIPGVDSAGVASRLPLSPGGSQRGVEIKGHAARPEGDISPSYLVVTPEYFHTLRIPLLKGRTFTDRDKTQATGAVIINAAMARHFWPNEDPVGQYIKVDRLDWSPVVGVVADIAQQGLDKGARPTIYVPYAQDPWPAVGLVMRTAVDPKSISSAAIAAIHKVDKDEAPYEVRTMHQVIDSSLHVRRFRTVLLILFASVALALAAIGVYGVISYSVTQRSREIGIRMALGAQPENVKLSIVRDGLLLSGYGIAAGLLASMELTRFLSGLLYAIKPNDAITFAATCAFLVLTALVATYIPANRAVRLEVGSILRGN